MPLRMRCANRLPIRIGPSCTRSNGVNKFHGIKKVADLPTERPAIRKLLLPVIRKLLPAGYHSQQHRPTSGRHRRGLLQDCYRTPSYQPEPGDTTQGLMSCVCGLLGPSGGSGGVSGTTFNQGVLDPQTAHSAARAQAAIKGSDVLISDPRACLVRLVRLQRRLAV